MSAEPARLGRAEPARLGDFTLTGRDLRLIPIALVVGVLSTAIALILLDLIGLVTNVAYFGRLSVGLVALPATLALPTVLIPVLGGLVIGLMARYGSERIRGHGIPEAMETILVGGSKVEPRLAVLKPVSSAISIGTGGPFGAEGPIILTGGAAGSLVGQLIHMSAAERKTLLVAGASAGMTAVFGTPVAAVLLGTELLLFEWRPRSLIPVAAACALAAALRGLLADGGFLTAAPLFPVPTHLPLDDAGLLGALAVGLVGGLLAWLLTACVYGAEDLFKRLPIHWMWWPILGGVIIGVGGLIDPRSLGVGYDSIRAELAGNLPADALLLLLVTKLVIWSLALGSGTSGGILAPLLLIGGAMGGVAAPLLPGGSPAIWALLGMAATLAGVTRSPFTSILFAVELTHDQNVLLPLLISCVSAYGVSALVLRRSILTEKVARRGFHVMREYGVDPLEALFVRDVMATNVLAVEPGRPLADLAALLHREAGPRRQRLYPVLRDGRLVGVIGRREIADAVEAGDGHATVGQRMRAATVAYGDETLRSAADRMSSSRLGMLPVVERTDPTHLLGLVGQDALLRARDRLLVEERHRERVLRPHLVPRLARLRRPAPPDDA
ncbi:MAG TPA: chloride channel protein [Candidatus Limnocylindrales bacterium]